MGPLLFLIYINDLDNGIVSKISKFNDDTKLCHSSRHPDEVLELQEDLNRLVDWANTWQMNFNIDKCAGTLVTTTSNITTQWQTND